MTAKLLSCSVAELAGTLLPGACWEGQAVRGGVSLEALCCRLFEVGAWQEPVPPAFSSLSLSPGPVPLLTKVHMVPASKGKILKGPRVIFTEWARRLHLERRGNKLTTSTFTFNFQRYYLHSTRINFANLLKLQGWSHLPLVFISRSPRLLKRLETVVSV